MSDIEIGDIIRVIDDRHGIWYDDNDNIISHLPKGTAFRVLRVGTYLRLVKLDGSYFLSGVPKIDFEKL